MTRNIIIEKEELLMLFNFLKSFLEMPYKDFEAHVGKQLVGCYCDELEYIHWVGNVARKCWFVTEGLIMVYINVDGKMKIYGFFTAGEIAILPDSFKSGKVSGSGFIALAGTKLLEISKAQMEVIYELFPQSKELENRIISAIFTAKTEFRARLSAMGGKQRIIAFHRVKPFNQSVGKQRSLKLLDKDKANFLNMDEATYCRLMRDIYGEDGI